MGMSATIALREKDLAVLRNVFHRFPSIKEIKVFGSRALGHARRSSDLDLAISAPEATISEWTKLTEALEECPLIYEMDVVRVEHLRNAWLLEKIEREGISIYPS